MQSRSHLLWNKREEIVTYLILLCLVSFILSYFKMGLLFSNTITTGGDLGSHYYPAKYLKEHLLPHFKIYGWSQAHFLGFPIFLSYFPLPFLAISFLSLILPFAIAFKLVTASGAFLIPFAAYLSLRELKFTYPIPITGAIFMIPFLFNEGNSMWGGNVPSTLSGEFAYQIGLALFIYFLGSMYRGAEEDKGVLKNAVVLSAIGMTHGYSFVFALAIAPFFIFTSRRDELSNRLSYLFWVYLLGTSFIAFWLVPMVANRAYTIAFKFIWTFRYAEALPKTIYPFLGFAALGAIVRPEKRTIYLSYSVITGIILFSSAFRLGVIDIRFVPFIQALLLILASRGFWILFALKEKTPLALALSALVLVWTSANSNYTADWIRWNYSGFESKKAWPIFKEINDYLRGSFRDPRVAVELSPRFEAFGTVRAFESLPLFSARQTLEGLHMISSISSPFVFFVQAETSESASCPYVDYYYPRFNLANGIAHLKLFNVRDVIVGNDETKRAFKKCREVRFKRAFDDVELYEVRANENRYVVGLKYKPVIFKTDDWKSASYNWFRRLELIDVPVIFNASEYDKSRDLRGVETVGSLDDVRTASIESSLDIKETIKDDEILITTSRIGHPLLIKISYHPNWHVEGAEKIFFVSPSFMLIYPKETAVRLYFGRRWPDYAGLALSMAGFAVLSLVALKRAALPNPFIKFERQLNARHRQAAIGLLLIYMATLGCGIEQYVNAPQRFYNAGIKLYDDKKYKEARRFFKRFFSRYPHYSLGDESRFFYAMSAYLNKNYKQAAADFDTFVTLYPDSFFTAEAVFNRGLSYFELGEEEDAYRSLATVASEFPDSVWAEHARDRLRKRRGIYL